MKVVGFRKIKYIVLDMTCFFSVLLIGADRIGISIAGVNIGANIRFDQVLLLLLAIILFFHNEYHLFHCVPLLIYLIQLIISDIFAYNPIRAIFYTTYPFYNTVFVFMVFASYVHFRGLKKFVNIWRSSMYVQCILLILQYLLGQKNILLFGLPTSGYWHGILRVPLWFYEPSYLATYFMLWSTISIVQFLCFNDKSYVIDILLSVLSIVVSASSTGFVGLSISFTVAYFSWNRNAGSVRKKILIIPLLFIAVLVLSHTAVFQVFVGRLFEQGIAGASGGRTSLYPVTWNVFLQHPIVGVGLGCYGQYLGGDNTVVPSNITLELLATTGIIGMVSFYLINIKVIFRSLKVFKGKSDEGFLIDDKRLVRSTALGLIVFLIVLQANQGPFRPYHWMFMGILYGTLFKPAVRVGHGQNYL